MCKTDSICIFTPLLRSYSLSEEYIVNTIPPLLYISALVVSETKCAIKLLREKQGWPDFSTLGGEGIREG